MSNLLWFLGMNNKIENLRETMELNDDVDTSIHERVRGDLNKLVKYTQQLEKRVGRLELICGAFVEVFKSQNMLTDQMLEILIARLDLEDGVEDGQQGPSSAARHTCPHCQRPANPSRGICVFCLEVLPASMSQSAAATASVPKAETVRCASCGKEVSKRSTFFTEQGSVCGACHGG